MRCIRQDFGAVLLQNNHSTAYANCMLTDPETRYAQIEKELLTVVYGLEKFHTYTNGRQVTVESDHKPLEVIVKKLLHRVPKNLQCMLLRVQAYSINLCYRGPPYTRPMTWTGHIFPTTEVKQLLQKSRALTWCRMRAWNRLLSTKSNSTQQRTTAFKS